MSFKACVIRKAVQWTPKGMVLWVANLRLKGIARLQDFAFDIDSRKAFVKTVLNGEAEPIEVLVEGFSVIPAGDSCSVVIESAQSNRPWLNNVFSKVVGRAWPVPVPPKFARFLPLVTELFGPRNPPA